jgi:hypothetical protein
MKYCNVDWQIAQANCDPHGKIAIFTQLSTANSKVHLQTYYSIQTHFIGLFFTQSGFVYKRA